MFSVTLTHILSSSASWVRNKKITKLYKARYITLSKAKSSLYPLKEKKKSRLCVEDFLTGNLSCCEQVSVKMWGKKMKWNELTDQTVSISSVIHVRRDSGIFCEISLADRTSKLHLLGRLLVHVFTIFFQQRNKQTKNISLSLHASLHKHFLSGLGIVTTTDSVLSQSEIL